MICRARHENPIHLAERQIMKVNDEHRRKPSRRDNGGVLLELALVTAIIALVIVALIGVVTKNYLPS
jgi:hypothetical protein